MLLLITNNFSSAAQRRSALTSYIEISLVYVFVLITSAVDCIPQCVLQNNTLYNGQFHITATSY